MKLDQKTLQDLSIFHKSNGLYDKVNLCTTNIGSTWLKQYMQQPPSTYASLLAHQAVIQYFAAHPQDWTDKISNGTLVLADKFFHSPETIISKPNSFSLFIDQVVRKVIPRHEQSLIKFSITQVMDFVKGCHDIVTAHKDAAPPLLQQWLIDMDTILLADDMQAIWQTTEAASFKELMILSYKTRRQGKRNIAKLMELYAQIDGIRALGIISQSAGWIFPELLPESRLTISLNAFYHPLLDAAIPYDLQLDKQQHFLFLTGANMSGKSTLIRSLGLNIYMAHLGMGIPAQQATISFFHGLITNMQIEDNLFMGESYFYAEVQRIKNTALQIAAQPYNLVLMDELFKGTNVHDAYDCTAAIIEAMTHKATNIMALSTHLYELGEQYKNQASIQQKYCETVMTADHEYSFTYRLKDGVSNDRIGYLVLKKEGVLDILNDM